MIFFIFIIISSIIPLITQFINKNLDFYDGSILKMLEHGFGKYLEAYVYIVLPLLLFLPFIFIIGYYFLSKNFLLNSSLGDNYLLLKTMLYLCEYKSIHLHQ